MAASPESPFAAAATLQTSRLASRAIGGGLEDRVQVSLVGNVPVRRAGRRRGPVGVEDPRPMRRVEAEQEGGHVEPVRSRGGLVPVDEAHTLTRRQFDERWRSSARDHRGAASRAPPTAARTCDRSDILLRRARSCARAARPGLRSPGRRPSKSSERSAFDRVADVRGVEVTPAIAAPEAAFRSNGCSAKDVCTRAIASIAASTSRLDRSVGGQRSAGKVVVDMPCAVAARLRGHDRRQRRPAAPRGRPPAATAVPRAGCGARPRDPTT